MTTASQPGEIAAAIKAGYRVTVHKTFFPFESRDQKEGTVHAVVDHGAQAIFCSQEWFDKCRQGTA
jgi:hypothetical protein